MSFTLKQAAIATTQGYSTVDVRLEGEQIAAIAPHLHEVGTLIDATNHLLLPGWVNAHTHSSEIWQRGLISPLPLELWLAQLYDYAPTQIEQVYLSALVTAVETLLSGGTTIVDHLVVLPGQEIESMEATIRAYQEVGVRAVVGALVEDLELSDSLPSGDKTGTKAKGTVTQQVLEFLGESVHRFHNPDKGIYIAIAPTGFQLCSDGLFEGSVELSDRFSLCRHAHLLESRAQNRLQHERFGGSAVKHLADLGFLSERTSCAHCIWLEDADIEILADFGATVVHNPLSNLRLGSGIAPVLKYLDAGINVALGCDGAASNDAQDMLEVLKIGSLLHNITTPEYRRWLTPRRMVEMASHGGARGIGLGDRLGTIEVGKQADLVLYDLNNLSLLPYTDPIASLVLGRPTNVVRQVWVRGDRVVADGRPTRIDIDDLKQELIQRSQWQTTQASSNFLQLERHYRRVLELDGEGE